MALNYELKLILLYPFPKASWGAKAEIIVFVFLMIQGVVVVGCAGIHVFNTYNPIIRMHIDTNAHTYTYSCT